MKTNTSHSAGMSVSAKVRLLVILAILSAASVVLGKFLQIPVGDSIRISFENLPVLFAGIVFGPVQGMAVGCVSDLVGCLAVGYSINPLITLGAVSVGFISGIISGVTMRDGRYKVSFIVLAVLLAHIVGSVIIKSAALRLWYSTPWSVLAIRIPVYFANTAAEAAIIAVLLRSSAIRGALRRFNGDSRKVQS